MSNIDQIIDDKIAAAVSTAMQAIQLPQGNPSPVYVPCENSVQSKAPSWNVYGNQTGLAWPAMQSALKDQEGYLLGLPPSTGGKTNLSSSFPSQTNHFSSALSLPENRHYLGVHTSPTGYTYIADIMTLQNAQQSPGVGPGSARSSGMVLFPDGEILMVPYSDTRYRIMQPATETGYILGAYAPGNYAYFGGALWTDGVSAILAPHSRNHAVLVNKSSGIVTELTGYNFGGNYACGGVRLCSTGEYYFVPHNHNKHVFLNPETMQFRTLEFDAPGGEAYVGCTNLSSGEIYVATHKAPCSVVIDPVSGAKIDTMPPSGSGYVAPTPGISNFRSCIRTPDGRVVLVPFSHTKCWIYDRKTNKHIQLPGTYAFGAVACASLTAYGDVMLWPWNGGAGYRLSTGYGTLIDPNIYTSPLFNGV